MTQSSGWRTLLRWKFDLRMLLGLFFLAGAALVALNAYFMFELFRSDAGRLCRQARAAYERGGAEALKLATQFTMPGRGMQLHLMNSGGRDVLTGAALSMVQVGGGSTLMGKPVVIQTGSYSCLVETPADAPGAPLGPMPWVLPFVSLLCCTVGFYVTRRMRRIEAVLNQFGHGQLAVRAAPDSGDAIGRLGVAFNEMAERITSLLAAHQRLCADMAHELHSPLTRLMLAVPETRKGTARAIDRIELEAWNIHDIVENLLQVARAEADPQALQLEPVDIGWLLTEIADDCAIEATHKGCAVDVEVAQRGVVLGDPDLLRSAFDNVLRNAMHYTPPETRIQLRSGDYRDHIVVTVRDWGPGVPEEVLSEIFQPFYRVDTSRGRGTGGVGLGLAIAQRAIALHGGEIRAKNCAPGLCVTITLPRYDRQDAGEL